MSYRQKKEESKNRRKQEIDKKLEDISYQQLCELAKKRMTTIMVGAIAKIETEFGYCWGNDELEEESMSKEQLELFNKFLDLRDSIFDQGNAQIKLFMNELGLYNIKRNRNTIEFKPKD